MGQAQVQGEQPPEVTYLPWEAAACACLPEHRDKLAKAGAFGGSGAPIAGGQQSPSKQDVDAIIQEKAVAWDSVFYVLAVGRGSREGLPSDCVPSLLSILTGCKITNRYLAEAAMLSLARLFAGTGNQLITDRITDLWESHEISNIRDYSEFMHNIRPCGFYKSSISEICYDRTHKLYTIRTVVQEQLKHMFTFVHEY